MYNEKTYFVSLTEYISMSNWKPLLGRISLFPVPTSGTDMPSALELFKKIWNLDPISFQGQVNPLAPSVAQGKSGALGLQASVHASRMDFTISSISPDDAPENEPQKLNLIEDSESFATELFRIADLIGRQFTDAPILRVATFAQFLCPGDSNASANKTLTEVIPDPYRIRLDEETDFILQVNTPRPSKQLPKLQMNLITKWSVDRLQVVTMLVPFGAGTLPGTQGSVSPHVTEFIAASVSFDNNNAPVTADQPLTSEMQAALLREGLDATAASLNLGGLKISGF
jgi:hypothetical protein